MENTKYFDIHVNDGGGNGFSVFVKIPTDLYKKPITDRDAIIYAVLSGKMDEEDAKYVDTVTETTEEDYKDATLS